MATLWGRTSFALALLSGLAFSQAPEFAQQYRQRLGGAIDELQRQVDGFAADAGALGLTPEQGMARLAQSEDSLARLRGENAQRNVERLVRLREQDVAMRGGGALEMTLAILANPDLGVASGAYEDFKPALPLTSDGAVCTGTGFLGGLGFFQLIGLPFRRRQANGERAPLARAG